MPKIARIVVALLIVLSVIPYGGSSAAASADDIGDMLVRAEALYYEADFAKSIELLLRADEMLRAQPGKTQQKTDVKLQLALGYLGMNDRSRAKSYLEELYALDPDRRIDPQLFPPKVIQLAEEAKSEQNEVRCRSLTEEVQRQLGSGKPDAVVKAIGSSQAKCPTVAALYPKVADLFFKEGLDLYKKAQMDQAVQKFRSALQAEPKHELAAQYLDLTQSKLEVADDRALLTWRKDFNAGDFASAARDYGAVLSRNNPDTVNEVRSEYRRSLSTLVEAWNQACAGNDVATMEELRLRVNAMLPESSFVEDLLAKMKNCTPAGCVQMSAPLALARLKSRVDPQFPTHVVTQLRLTSVTVRIKAKINENGDVVSSELQGGNPLIHSAVREAFNQWKFTPTVMQGDTRCVETEIPLVINFATK